MLVECSRSNGLGFVSIYKVRASRTCPTNVTQSGFDDGYETSLESTNMAKRVQQVTTKNQGRFYRDADGQEYWSVTTILKDGIPKNALTQWAGNESAKYVMQQLIEPLRAIKDGDGLRSGWLEDFSFDTTTYKSKKFYTSLASLIASDEDSWNVMAYDQIRNASNRTRDAAGADGSNAHKMIEAYILATSEGSTFDWDAALETANENVRQVIARFREFEEEWEPEYEATELTVFNPTAGYAGNLDFIAKIPALGEGLTLGDFKTGRGVFPETSMQMAAYRHAEFAEIRGGKMSVPMPKTERAVVVHLRPDDAGSYEGKHPKSYYEVVPMQTDEAVFDMFRYVTQVAWFTREGEKWQSDPITHEQAMADRFAEQDSSNED